VKEFLSRAGIGFVDRNVDKDDTAYRELLATGWRTVPVTLIDGTAVKGFDEAQFRALLFES
jgi:glutaredoxin